MRPGKKSALLTKPEIKSPNSRCATSKTPRRPVFNLTQTEKQPAPLEQDFELNREIFTPNGSRQRKSSANSHTVVTISDIDLMEIKTLSNRIPDPSTISEDEAFSLTPILDRILGTVCSWEQPTCAAMANNEDVINLQQKLFGLIEVDDFLVRVIVCRILFCFAVTDSYDLLGPIAKIFYKFSLDKNNFDFFVEESLESVLLSLLQTPDQEASVYSAAAIKNLSKYLPFVERIYNVNFIQAVIPFFKGESDEQVKGLLIEAISNMCNLEKFRKDISQSNFITILSAEPGGYQKAMALVPHIPELSTDERLQLIADTAAAIKPDYTSKELLQSIVNYVPPLFETIEGAPESAPIVLELIKTFLKDNDYISAPLRAAAVVCKNQKAALEIEADGVVQSILSDVMYDSDVILLALNVVKMFPSENSKKMAAEYSKMLGQ